MIARNPDAEAELEAATLRLFDDLGWDTISAYNEVYGPGGTLGREHAGEIVLTRHLRPALESLNPDLPPEAIDLAVEELLRDRAAMSLPQANRELYELLREGVPVTYRDEDSGEVTERARVIDWSESVPGGNHFLVVSQLWVTGELYRRRADLVGFVNGIPLLFIELKTSHRRLEHAYEDNLRDYKDTIPRILRHNGFILLSNGSDTRVGTLTAGWEHFSEWKKISDEEEPGVVSLETAVRGTCERTRFLDIIENFVLYQDTGGSLIKILAKNHQYLGVNNAIREVTHLGENQGRLGVFWHTQGSGKSFSMIFFSRKVLRTIPGDWSFLIVTDRIDLDDQIYKNFAGVGAVTEPEHEIRAQDGRHLQRLLQENHRYLFTLIQKFQAREGEEYPEMSDRRDVIVMTDEAHRTQYDVLAMNMRRGLPNAAFLAFTGTPLIAGEERTREVFGDYVSVYDFQQSIRDRATVPLYYENRVPELQLINEDFDREMEALLEDAELDEEQEKKLEREFGREYYILTRDERLDAIAEDLVDHFLGRGHLGKAMVVSVDRLTAVRMYEKVRHQWNQRMETLRLRATEAEGEQAVVLERRLDYMRQTDMAVVISQAQNEVADFRDRGLDIRSHRERMVKEDLETRFKDPDDPFRIVFVCSMWMTGFDAPAISTIYLDKPMRNHTLMQTIARANRVHGRKEAGVIVDYVGVFRNLRKALAIYGTGLAGGPHPGEMPVVSKDDLAERVRQVADDLRQLLELRGVDVEELVSSEGLERVALKDRAVEAILHDQETRATFTLQAGLLRRLHRAILPDPRGSEMARFVGTVHALVEKIRSLSGPVDVSEVMEQVETLLDESVATRPFVIQERDRRVDLSQIDFERLRDRFQQGQQRAAAERLKALLVRKSAELIRRNRTRIDFLERLERLIADYNTGSKNVEAFFRELMEFAALLSDEEQRAVAEELTEEELAIFDLLTKPEMELTEKEVDRVKQVARELLESLKREKLVLDWRKRQQTRAAVRLAIETTLDELPGAYKKPRYDEKCEAIYQHVFDSYRGADDSVFVQAA